jgi:threonine/homoserine/homoserine lactone efflux protein
MFRPDRIAFILGHAVRSEVRAGFAAMFGISSGACAHVLMTAAGLSVVLAASAIAFSAVKGLGAIYLLWIGIQALCSKWEGLPTV